MRTKLTALTIAGALALGGGIGYAAAGAGSATAQPSAARGISMDGSMIGGDSMMAQMMDAEHAKMMRNPAMREMHRTMVREHANMMRDGEMRRQHEQAMRDFPAMARMMREHMGS
jgi:hypothetical protein